MTEEWIELKALYKGKIRKSTINDICSQWLMDMGMMTPKQLKHIERAMSMAIFDQKVLAEVQSSASSTIKEDRK